MRSVFPTCFLGISGRFFNSDEQAPRCATVRRFADLSAVALRYYSRPHRMRAHSAMAELPLIGAADEHEALIAEAGVRSCCGGPAG